MAPQAMQKQSQQQKALTESQQKGTVDIIVDKTKAACVQFRDRTTTIVKNPEFQKVVISTGSGTAVFGVVGGAFGGASGIVIGSAVGLPPALLTFGLSIPVCATVGGAGGLACGTLVGGGAGGVAGVTTYKYRLEIKQGVVVVKVRAMKAASALKDQAATAVSATKQRTSLMIRDTTYSVRQAARVASGKASVKASEALTFASSTRAGVTSTSAVAGGVVGSTAGGGAGIVMGAAAGVVPAIFTFGLSIPVGAVLGLCCGTAVGGSVGVVSGGALGYGGFAYRKELGSAKSKIGSQLGGVTVKLGDAAGQVKQQMTQMTMSRAHTGGSEGEDQ